MTDPRLYTVPVETQEAYRMLRVLRPASIIPLPGEPVVPGDLPRTVKIYASDGNVMGWLDLTSDVFTPVR